MFQKNPILKVQKEQHHLELLQHRLPGLWPVHQQPDQVRFLDDQEANAILELCVLKFFTTKRLTRLVDMRTTVWEIVSSNPGGTNTQNLEIIE